MVDYVRGGDLKAFAREELNAALVAQPLGTVVVVVISPYCMGIFCRQPWAERELRAGSNEHMQKRGEI